MEKNARGAEEAPKVTAISPGFAKDACATNDSTGDGKKQYMFNPTMEDDGLGNSKHGCQNPQGGGPEHEGKQFTHGTVAVCRAGRFLGRCKMSSCSEGGRSSLQEVVNGKEQTCSDFTGAAQIDQCESHYKYDQKEGNRLCQKHWPTQAQMEQMSPQEMQANKDGMCELGAPCNPD